MTFRFTLGLGRSLPGSSCWVSCCLAVLYHSPWLSFSKEKALPVLCFMEGSSLQSVDQLWSGALFDSTMVSNIFFSLESNLRHTWKVNRVGARAFSSTQHVSQGRTSGMR